MGKMEDAPLGCGRGWYPRHMLLLHMLPVYHTNLCHSRSDSLDVGRGTKNSGGAGAPHPGMERACLPRNTF